jgi:Uma2 family endonuclease
METREKVPTDYERERGKPMPSKLHGIIQQFLGMELGAYYPKYLTFQELTLEIDDEGAVTPDVCVYQHKAIDYEQDETRVTEPPLIAIEIVSPSQALNELVSKGRRLIRAGTRSAWIVQPSVRTVTVLTGERDVKTYERGETLHDPSTGIEIDLDRVFREPPSNPD